MWIATSSLLHITVLFTPITTVMVLGEKLRLELDEVPAGIVTSATEAVADELAVEEMPGGMVCPV